MSELCELWIDCDVMRNGACTRRERIALTLHTVTGHRSYS